MNGGMVVPTSDGKAMSEMTDWTSLRYVVVDVEGNGQQPPDLVELSAVPIVAGVIGKPVSWLVKPELPIRAFAARIHGLTDESVADAPTFAEITEDVLKALDVDALIAHNAHVDVGVLQRQLGDWACPEVFDTLKLARRLLPGRDTDKRPLTLEELRGDPPGGGDDEPATLF
jgi:exodeoxyribonuclease X